jgi:chemotaxis protein CheD
VHANPAVAGARHRSAHANVALDDMYALLRARGINPMMCQAYAYGGGNMFPDLLVSPHVGEGNSQWVVNALAHDGVVLLAHDFGGNTYRRLSWTVGAGAPEVSAVAL